jgi:Flp pilus assembly pilin Flp
MVEYGLIIALVAVALIGALNTFSGTLDATFEMIANSIP